MIKYVLNEIGNVAIYGLISLCLFFGFFSVMLIWAFLLRKRYLETMSVLPLNDEFSGREMNER